MIPTNRNNPQQIIPQNALTVDKHTTIYVLLAGVAGGLVLAVVVMVCCKVCLRKKKPFTRELKEFDPDELLESGLSQSWMQAPDNGTEDFGEDIELQELPKTRASMKGKSAVVPKRDPKREDHSDSSSPERPPEPTSVVRRRSSVGIQRQASVCLSDEEDQTIVDPRQHSGERQQHSRTPALPQREVTRVAAIVHRSCNDKPPPPHSWDQTSVCSSSSQPVMGIRHHPFIHSHSSPDSGSTANMLNQKHGRVISTHSLHGIPADLARVVDLEDYHYSRQQVWELAAQGEALLKDKSRSNLDVVGATEGWTDDPSQIQQAASTEGGLLELSLEQHQLEHLRSLLKRYSPVDEEDAKIWSKVRYNDTGSREDIREEVIEMISGESSDDSNSSLESEILKQQSRQLWELRATLEEEEDKLSDTQEIKDDPPEEEASDPQDVLASRATSFESNADVSCDDPGYECDESDYLQLPSHEIRRNCYKSLLTKRLQKRTPGTESSFDSIESSSTDRTEGATTSFESTTDNTDSTGEGQTNRLQQMKADSGYKSMESNGKAPRLCRKQLQFNLEGDSLDQMTTMEGTFEEELDVLFKDPDAQGTVAQGTDTIKTKSIETSKVVSFEGVTIEGESLPPSEPQVHKKKYKSALKKHCTESDIQWSEQQMLTEMTAESRGKTSVFQRFFRSGRLRFEQMQQFRDYSIDEKSDALFREFSRPDIGDTEYYRTRGARLHTHMRLHHRSLPSTESSGSPHLPRKVLSPQQSIEEESGGEEEKPETRSPRETQAQIPVICLPQAGEGQ
ncbi:uncharacterized protein LOC129218072 isoform X1 [Uloborus diversus]|uniref:uncharacterized protein LOC129218072 isoform X1 n=1 Tax=Uloborus diversus TaxID=327109 RepID=UPI002409355F|nr:uncharacterized protein LOC129218072 isoform X1 [Uloborus diversus]